jgi:hypothetical protein
MDEERIDEEIRQAKERQEQEYQEKGDDFDQYIDGFSKLLSEPIFNPGETRGLW